MNSNLKMNFYPLFGFTVSLLFLTTCTLPKSTSMQNTTDIDTLWKEVDSLEKQSLPRSALKLVRDIKEKAISEDLSNHFVKALLYENKFQIGLEEEGFEKAIVRMQTEVERANQPERAILQSYLGELYHRYLQQNQWKLQNRTSITNETGDIFKQQ